MIQGLSEPLDRQANKFVQTRVSDYRQLIHWNGDCIATKLFSCLLDFYSTVQNSDEVNQGSPVIIFV